MKGTMTGRQYAVMCGIIAIHICGCGSQIGTTDISDVRDADVVQPDSASTDTWTFEQYSVDVGDAVAIDSGRQDGLAADTTTTDDGPGDILSDGSAFDVTTADVHQEVIDDSFTDPGSITDGGRTDAPVDPGHDAITDTVSDATGDSFQDATDTLIERPGLDAAACPDVDCRMECGDAGYKTDELGCPVCRCRECTVNEDCLALGDFLCQTPVCSPEGDCTCDCTDFVDLDYICPDGTVITYGRCSESGITFLNRVEEECPTLCGVDDSLTIGCPDNLDHEWCHCDVDPCRPECRLVGTFSEGWYDGCTDLLIAYDKCAGQEVSCVAIGSKSEAWVDSAGLFLGWDNCAPRWSCDAISDVCPSMICDGTTDPGVLTCPGGSTSEFCTCTLHQWTCFENPTSVCAGRWRGCAMPLSSFKVGPYFQCCPGLVWLRGVMDNGMGCVTDGCNPSGYCSECGDGACRAPEDRCNCPEDCLSGTFPGYAGSPCRRDTECPPMYECVGNPDEIGVCTPL